MNISPRLLLIAAGIGLVIQILIILMSVGAVMFMLSTDYGNSTASALVGIMGLVSSLACLCPLIVDIGVGGFYAFLQAREGIVTPGDGILGGAAASGLARVVSSLSGVCLNLIVTPFMYSQMEVDMPPEAMGMIFGSSIIGGIISLVMGLVIGCLLGALGGGVEAVLFEEKQNPVRP